MRYDDEEFEAFYRKNYSFVYWFFRRARVDDDEAHELTQDVFLRAWKGRGDYRHESERKYLRTIALRVLLRRNELLRNRLLQLSDSIEDPAVANLLVQPAPDVETLEEQRLLRERIARLPPLTRDCVLYRIDGYKYKEIARMLRLTEDQVKDRLIAAKDILKEDDDDDEK